jgi:predicted MFS family arabinose efflux permease
VTAAALPNAGERRQHVIDYAGIITLTLAASALILFTSLGGSDFAWMSWKSIALLIGGLALTVVFVVIERRSSEPVLPPSLFSNRVFSSASAIGFVVGFAMFGAMTFLPLYFQDVHGASPTNSGLRLLPMMVGLFSASIFTGQLVVRGWRYRPFPVAGTAVMTVGIGLLGTIGVTTSTIVTGTYMLILGVGIGLVMQILVTAVQNAVNPADVGAATAGSNFFRSIGGSFGTAVFGAIFSNELPHQLVAGIKSTHYTGALPPASQWTPTTLHALPAKALYVIVHAISSSISHIYLLAIPVGVVAVLLSLTLPEVKLRTSLHPVADEVPLSNADPLV